MVEEVPDGKARSQGIRRAHNEWIVEPAAVDSERDST